MNRKRFLWFFAVMAVCIITFTACGDGDNDNTDDIENPGTGGGGGSAQSYALSQLQGHWVVADEWERYTRIIREIESSPSSRLYPDAFLNDSELSSGGVDGFYITGETAYEVGFTITDTKYANNSVEGNTIVKSWYYPDKTVYFMNVVGGKYKHTCSIYENKLTIGWGNSFFTVLSTSSFCDASGTMYEKVNVKNF